MIKIEVRNLDIVLRNLAKLKGELPRYIGAANQEAAREILDTQGLRKYPPATDANQPPTPYYIRGRGMQYAKRNLNNSERLGTRWITETYGQLGVKISNPASYAQWVHGKKQATAMGRERIGWRKLFDTAKEKTSVLVEIYAKWINKLIRDSGL